MVEPTRWMLCDGWVLGIDGESVGLRDAMASGAAIRMTKAALYFLILKKLVPSGRPKYGQRSPCQRKCLAGAWQAFLLATFAEQETNSFRYSINRLIYIVV